MTQPACTRCFSLAFAGRIRAETVMPLPESAPPMAIEDCGEHSPPNTPICHDCQAAENLAKLSVLAAWVATEPGGLKRPWRPEGMGVADRRIVSGNERQEQLRLPAGMRPHFGLVREGLVKATVDPPDYDPDADEGYGCPALEAHHAWLETVGIKLGMNVEDGAGEDREVFA